jgi:hypothetical protein
MNYHHSLITNAVQLYRRRVAAVYRPAVFLLRQSILTFKIATAHWTRRSVSPAVIYFPKG